MKNTILLSLAVILMASCSSKMSLVKRKYNKGFYVSVNKKAPAPGIAEARELKTPVKTDQSTVETVIVQPVETVAPQSENGITKLNPAVMPAAKSEAIKELKTITAAADKELIATDRAVKPLNTMTDSRSGSGASDANKVLLIILALFPILSLIAVYLHDGSITLNFWVTLLLHFIFLYWLFALLVVLDVIDLG